MRYAAFLFDFDYTLGDATDGIAASFDYAFGKMGLPGPPREAVRATVGLPLPEAFGRLTGDGDAGLAARFSRLFKEEADRIMTANTRLYPFTVKVLGDLKELGARTGIVTTKYRYRIEEILRKYDCANMVDAVVGGEDVQKPKPDPEGLFLALRLLGAGKGGTLYAGDTVIDAAAAKRAGIDFAAVLTGTTGREGFAGYPCKYVLSDLSELTARLNPERGGG